jgi:DNA-binding HxlR family transcriptional regulator
MISPAEDIYSRMDGQHITYFLHATFLALECETCYTIVYGSTGFQNTQVFMANQKWQEGMATKPTESTLSPSQVAQICPRYEHAAQLLGKRWTGLLLDALMSGPRRFCELTSLVEGLSDRVLSDRLRELEVEGVVQRVVYPHIPVRVEYQLTEKGYALKPVIDAIHTWANEWVSVPAHSSTNTAASTEIAEADPITSN